MARTQRSELTWGQWERRGCGEGSGCGVGQRRGERVWCRPGMMEGGGGGGG